MSSPSFCEMEKKSYDIILGYKISLSLLQRVFPPIDSDSKKKLGENSRSLQMGGGGGREGRKKKKKKKKA